MGKRFNDWDERNQIKHESASMTTMWALIRLRGKKKFNLIFITSHSHKRRWTWRAINCVDKPPSHHKIQAKFAPWWEEAHKHWAYYCDVSESLMLTSREILTHEKPTTNSLAPPGWMINWCCRGMEWNEEENEEIRRKQNIKNAKSYLDRDFYYLLFRPLHLHLITAPRALFIRRNFCMREHNKHETRTSFNHISVDGSVSWEKPGRWKAPSKEASRSIRTFNFSCLFALLITRDSIKLWAHHGIFMA